MTYEQKAELLTQNLSISGLLGLVTELSREIDKIKLEKEQAKCLKENPAPSAPKKTK